MIVNKSMYPVQTGFSVISQMQQRMSDLQMQLGTGQKSNTLAGMKRDLPMSLSVRSRLDKIEGYSANIETVDLRLSFLDNTMTRFDKIEGEGRTSAVQGQYGTNNINMATLPDLSKARFDEVVEMLNSDVAGRYLFGGAKTDKPPVASTDVLLDGEGGRAGFKTVVGERKAADAGLDNLGRLKTAHLATTTTVNLTEDGVHPFGLKVSTISSTSPAVTTTGPTPGGAGLGDGVQVTFAPTPADQIQAGHAITLGFTLPDGTETQITLKAVATGTTPGPDEFAVGADAEATAISFQTALQGSLKTVTGTTLAGASTYAAATNFFNSGGEPVLRVQGNPATATALRVADDSDTVIWYKGQSPAISAEGLGRLDIATTGATTSLGERAPSTPDYGFQITGISPDTANINTTYTAADPSTVSVQFTGVPAAGETVTLGLVQPDGTTRSVALTAVVGNAGPGQFTIGADANATAANFSSALNTALTAASKAAEGNPRQSVSAQVDDSSRTNYGLQANEGGFVALMRTFGSMAIETYPDGDPTSKGRFDAMATRQASALSEQHNSERGSIEIVTMELAVAKSTNQNAAARHVDYKSQLENLLSDVETVSEEDTAMAILALQTRLQASYQVTAMVSKLSLANYL
jgi:flagellar hook-associated protein 3 FlgL